MPLQISQYVAPAPYEQVAAFQSYEPILYDVPRAVDNLSVGASVTIGGTSPQRRIVRLLAQGSDLDVVWPGGLNETLKDGTPTYRVLVAGTGVGCAAAG